jgi:hypothetical protein
MSALPREVFEISEAGGLDFAGPPVKGINASTKQQSHPQWRLMRLRWGLGLRSEGRQCSPSLRRPTRFPRR